MENNLDTGREFNWDDVISKDDYDFEVKSFERGRHNGSEKLPPCNKAVLKIRVSNSEGKASTITHNLMLHSKCEGLICAFFTAIGQRKHGEQLKMNWNTVVGSRGRCKVGVRTYKSTKTGQDMQTNEIQRFYDPADAKPQAESAPQQTGFGGGFAGGFGGGFGKR